MGGMSEFFRKKIPIAFFVFIPTGLLSVFLVFFSDATESPETVPSPEPAVIEAPAPIAESVPEKEPPPPPPPPPSMERMKREGCVADGLLNGDFPKDGKTIDLVNRSK